MLHSLRARLFLWFTAVMLAAVAGFGALVLYTVWRARLADIDAALAVRADALVGSLRPAPDGTFVMPYAAVTPVVPLDAKEAAAAERRAKGGKLPVPGGPPRRPHPGRRQQRHNGKRGAGTNRRAI